MLRQNSYAIKNQLKAPKAPTRGIPCISLVLYGIRIGGFHARKESMIVHPFMQSLDISCLRACWFEKKQQLNENIARVCNKYADYIDKIGRFKNKDNFIQYGNMVNCIIQKV